MTEVVSVRFKNKGKVYFFDPVDMTIAPSDHLVVETAKGLEYAECVLGNHMVEDTSVCAPLRPVIRIATSEDTARAEENRLKEAEAFKICRKKIAQHNLDMKLVDVEYNFEGNKILFFFTSEGRVDFRELVKDLASVFKTRIELRQIGVRDESRMLGGLGICGKPFCCSQFLDDFQPVSIKMAKTQGLSLNPAKISGTCGRLMCCLKYEQDAYEDLVKNVPKVDSFVETSAGVGSVVDINLLKRTVRVKLEDSTETAIKTFSADDVNVLGGKAKRAEYIAMRAEEKSAAATPIIQIKKLVGPVDTQPKAMEKAEEITDERAKHTAHYAKSKSPSAAASDSTGQQNSSDHEQRPRSNQRKDKSRHPQNNQHDKKNDKKSAPQEKKQASDNSLKERPASEKKPSSHYRHRRTRRQAKPQSPKPQNDVNSAKSGE